ncbi:MAG: tetratricopeptide repeat protein [Smithellaceae bacterium]|jgi:tetratricopeptide (TPR) repeat protein
MKKMLFKTVVRLFIPLALLIVFTSHHSFAGSMDNTLCEVIVNRNGTPRLVRDMGGQWTNPVLVFSNKNINVYTGSDTITGNLFWGNIYGDFLGTGNFTAQLYIEVKDKKLRKKIAETLKLDISKQPSLAMIGHPDLFTYLVDYAFFDMKNNIVSLRKWEKFLDRDGDLIMLRNAQENIPLDNKSDHKLIAKGIISALNKAKNDPEIADRIRDMQKYGNNMTDVSRNDALRNFMITKEQKPMPIGKTDFVDKTQKAIEIPKDIEYLNEAIRLKPGDAEAYVNRGHAYAKLGEYQRAITDYNEAIRLKPDFSTAYNHRGIVYNNLGQYQRAIEDYAEAIRLKPDYAEAYHNRGGIYFVQGNNELCCRDAQKACDLGSCELLKGTERKGMCR